MAAGLPVLIVVGLICGIGLCMLVYFLWKYIRLKKSDDLEMLSPKSAGKNVVHHQSIKASEFAIPKPYMAVKQQYSLPGNLVPTLTITSTDEIKSSNVHNTSSLKLQRKFSGGQCSVPRSMDDEKLYYGRRVRSHTTNSLNTKEKACTQKLIAAQMFYCLRKQRKSDLLRSEDGYLSASSADISSNESIKSNTEDEEVYETASICQDRKKLSKRRPKSKSYDNKGKFRKEGKISFSTEYKINDNILEIFIGRIHGIALKRDITEIRPFVTVYTEPGKKQKQTSKVHKHTKDFFVNEKFKMTHFDPDDFEKSKLKFKVFNHSKLRSHELLNEVEVPLTALDPLLKETFDIDLFAKRSPTTMASVLISLNYEVTFSKLSVTIEQAKNLPKGKRRHRILNPFAVVTMFRENNEEKRNTVSHRNTNDPVFDASFDFYVITDHEKRLSSFSLVVTIMNHTLIGHDEIIGHVILSLSSPQLKGVEHWQAVADAPHKKHTVWHALLDPDDI